MVKGDHNIALFHAVLQRKTYRNNIYSIQDNQGQLIQDPEGVADCIRQYYVQLLGCSSTRRSRVNQIVMDMGARLSIEQQLLLIKPFTDQDIKRAIWDIADNKSPGPDGFGSGFFKKAWPIIGAKVCEAVKEFFHNGRCSKAGTVQMLCCYQKQRLPGVLRISDP